MNKKLRTTKSAQKLKPAMEAAFRDLNGLKQCIQMQMTLLRDLEHRLDAFGLDALGKEDSTNSEVKS